MATILEAGVNVIINQRIAGKNTPVYPFTKTALVQDAAGNNLDTIVAGLALKEHGNHVPTVEENVSNLRFLRNDNTWADIQAASTTQAGVVQLSDATNLEDSTVAATAKAVKLVKDAVDSLGELAGDTYVEKTLVGAQNGVASLDENGYVPASQLPSYVDDVIEVAMNADLTEATLEGGTVVVPESGKIYVDVVGETATSKTYRWSGTKYAVISETLALGETASTAFDGLRGKAAYDHSLAAHARVDATLTEGSENNGYVKINGSEVLVYTHPGTGTNPHGTTAADLGLGNVENKSAATILDEITADLIGTKLGYTAQNAATLATASNNGVMSSTYAAKLDNCMQMEITSGTPTITDGIVFQIVAEA